MSTAIQLPALAYLANTTSATYPADGSMSRDVTCDIYKPLDYSHGGYMSAPVLSHTMTALGDHYTMKPETDATHSQIMFSKASTNFAMASIGSMEQAAFPYVNTHSHMTSPPEPLCGSPESGTSPPGLPVTHRYAGHITASPENSNTGAPSAGDPYNNVMVWLNQQACGGTVKRKRKITRTQRSAANVRERRRMVHLNSAFEVLRDQIPMFPYEKRPSRIQTLRLAMDYIAFMTDIIRGTDKVTSENASDVVCTSATTW